MADGPRYAFHPLERRGLLLGLDGGKLATIAAGAVMAVAAHAMLGGPLGVFCGLVLVTGGLAGALWTRDGSSLAARAVAGLAWLSRRPRVAIDDGPVLGRVGTSQPADPLTSDIPPTTACGVRPARTTRPAGVELVRDGGLPGEGPLGLVRDRRSGTFAGVIPVSGCSYSLLDPGEQAHRLEAWRRVLGSLARPGSPVARVQWLRRSWTGGLGGSTLPHHAPASDLGARDGDPAGSYHRLSASAGATMTHHQAWVLVAVRPSHHQLRRPARGMEGIRELRRELRLLAAQLRDAGLHPLDPLDPEGLHGLMSSDRAAPVRAGGGPWPLAATDGWSTYRADGAWHATYWVAEWPRIPVGPDFLTPLLVGPERITVSVVMAPVAPDRAMREVRSARTADMADAELKARAGFLPSARRERESEGVAQREAELADGHHEFRFSGYVTVSADDPEQLSAACAATEHAAQSARIELRRLFGRQAEGYTWTLPLGRGLR